MQQIFGVIKAIYNFFVGDMVILIGALVVFIIAAALLKIDPNSTVSGFIGAFVAVGMAAALGFSLYREIQPHK